MQCIHCFLSQSIDTESAEISPEALFDQYNINVLLLLIEESDKKNDIQIFKELLKSNYINKEKFMRNMVFSVLQSNKDLFLTNVVSFLELIHSFNDFVLAGKSLASLMTNPLFWNNCENALNTVLYNIHDLMGSNFKKYPFNEMCEDGLMEILLLAMHLHKGCQNIIIEIVSLLLKVTETKYVNLVVDFCRITPYFVPFASVDAIIVNTNTVKNTDLQIRLASLIIEKDKYMKLIPYPILVQLGVELNFFDAKICAIELINRMAVSKETYEHLPIIADICKKFYKDAIVWENVISKTIDEKFEFINAFKHSYELKKPVYVILILMMLTPYSCTEIETDLSRTIFQITMMILRSNPSILTKKLIIPFFLKFIMNATNENSYQTPDFSQSNIDPELIEKLKANYNTWNRLRGNETLDKKVSSLYVEKVASILSEVTFVAYDKVTLIKMVCQFADEAISQSYLFYIFSKYVEVGIPSDIAQPISKEMIWIASNRQNILANGSIDSILAPAVAKNPNAFGYFIHFFLIRLDVMAPETIEVFVEALTIVYVQPELQLLHFVIYTISRFIRSNLPRELPFIDKFFQKTKNELKKISFEEIPLARNIIEAPSFDKLKFTEEEIMGYDQIFKQKVEVKDNELKNWVIPFLDEYLWPTTHKYYTFYVKNIRTEILYQRKLEHHIDICLREKECFMSAIEFHKAMSYSQSSSSIQDLEERTKSYRISSFFSPCTVPTVLIPSSVELYTPGNQRQTPVEEEKFEFLGHKANFIYGHSKFAVSFQNDILEQLEQTYKAKEFTNCTIIRLFTRVKSVMFKTPDNDIFMILINAAYNKETRKLSLGDENEHYIFMRECVFEGDYGNFSLFLDHPIIILQRKQATIYKYISCGVITSVQVFSKLNGVFIIEFEGKQILDGLEYDISPLKEKWKEGLLSNFDYLLAINHAAKRSFVDLSCYPIFPRVITDFTQQNIGPFRDLSKPIQIECDKDQNHNLLKIRYDVQGYHHSDNISNPHFVSGNLVRIVPFCNAQWEMNEKWDATTRIMMSVPTHYTITNYTIYELIPESFIFVEGFINVNEFVLPTKEVLDVIFPAWATSPSDFITKHRGALESIEVSSNLHKWIDLIFGFKSRKREAFNEFNTYHPLSYAYTNEEPTKEKHDWILTCGQVPQRVFKDPHPKQLPQPVLPNVLNRFASVEYAVEIDNANGLITTSHLSIKQPTPGCINGRCDGETLVLTYSRFVYSCSIPSLEPLAFLFRMNSLFSVPCTKLMICATAFINQVVIWSLANGFVIKTIKVSRPSRIVFLKNDNNLIIESEGDQMVVTPNGTPI